MAEGYESASQKVRVLTESWVGHEAFCPACGNPIKKSGNNSPVLDFYCPRCTEGYELKSSKNPFGQKVLDGAYDTMIKRLEGRNTPNFFLLNYSPRNYAVVNFFVIPKHFLVPEMIEKRKPLSESARRPKWVGCNIVLQNIPQTGKIFYVKDRQVQSRDNVLQTWKRPCFFEKKRRFPKKPGFWT